MTIAFPDITINILQPSQEQFTENAPHHTLIVGQKNGGTAVSGELVTEIGNSGEEDTLFGPDSMAAGMVRYFKRANKESKVDVISLDDAGGSATADSTVTFTNTADAAGSFTVSIGTLDHVFTIPVSSGDTVTAVAAALAAAVNADTRCPVNASALLGVVTLSAVNAGLEGNNIGIKVSGSAGAMTITATAFTGGLGNPGITTLFNNIQDIRYQTIVFPSTYDRDVLEDFLDARWNVSNDILDGVGIFVLKDTLANVVTVVNASNSQNIATGINVPQTITDKEYRSTSFIIENRAASYIAGIRALRLTTGANLSNFVVADASDDKTGGIELASLPYANTPLYEIPVINVSELLKRSEIKELNDAGAFAFSNDPNNLRVILGQMVTAFKTNTAGNPDTSLKYLNYVDTISNVREFFFNNLRNRFRQTRLTDGQLTEGKAVENQSTITAYVDSIYFELAERQLVVKGPEAVAYFKENRYVTINKQAGSAYIFARIPIVTQLRTIIFDMQLSFDDLTV